MTDRLGKMGKRERVEAVLAGRTPDRPPFSFWYHFPKDQVAGEACARAHLDHYRRHRVDFLKVMNDNGYPVPEGGVTTVDDLPRVRPQGIEAPEFQNQLEALRIVAEELGDEALFVTTLFNPLSVLDSLSGRRAVGLIRADRHAADAAMAAIAKALADFADACIRTGAAGVFMSCSDKDLNAVLGHGTYAELVKPHDLAVFDGAAGAPLNVVHIHEKADDFEAFLDYPVSAINWGDRADGPSIADVRGPVRNVIMAGMDHVGTIVEGTVRDIADEIRDAVEQAGEQPIIIAPGCSFPSDVPEEKLSVIYETLATEGEDS